MAQAKVWKMREDWMYFPFFILHNWVKRSAEARSSHLSGVALKLHLENEGFPEIEIILYRYDGSNCLAVADGQSVSLVSRASVMEAVESVQAIVLN